MQKKILCASILTSLSGMALAQSNVVLSGNLDMFYANFSQTSADSVNALNSGGYTPSRIIFAGSEDFGNGVKAIFKLHYHLGLDINGGIGATGPGSRETYLGVATPYGTVRGGRIESHGVGVLQRNKFGVGGGHLSPIAALGVNSGALETTDTRFSNALAYDSPRFAGVQVLLSYALGVDKATKSETPDGGHVWEVGADYKNGPISVGFVHGATKDSYFDSRPVTVPTVAGNTVNNEENTDQTSDVLAGTYDFGVVKIKANYQWHKTEKVAGTSMKEDIWGIGAEIPVFSRGAIQIGYEKLDNKLSGSEKNDTDGYTLGYTHSLSKRTTLYAVYTYLDNSGTAKIGAFGTTGLTTLVEPGGNLSITALGMNHAF
jgi:predicted porin